jgi:hypothetical protein
MLPAAQSPIHEVVSDLWRRAEIAQPPPHLQVPSVRERLYSAAAEEIRKSLQACTVYDPAGDFRFRWAVQFLEVADGSRRHIDPDITTLATMFFTPAPPPSFKHIAANDT